MKSVVFGMLALVLVGCGGDEGVTPTVECDPAVETTIQPCAQTDRGPHEFLCYTSTAVTSACVNTTQMQAVAPTCAACVQSAQ